MKTAVFTTDYFALFDGAELPMLTSALSSSAVAYAVTHPRSVLRSPQRSPVQAWTPVTQASRRSLLQCLKAPPWLLPMLYQRQSGSHVAMSGWRATVSQTGRGLGCFPLLGLDAMYSGGMAGAYRGTASPRHNLRDQWEAHSSHMAITWQSHSNHIAIT